MVDYYHHHHQKIILLMVFFFFFLLESTIQQKTSSSSEKSILLDLRSTLGIRSKDWPIKGDPCLNWNGIRCDQNGTVIEINLSGFKRTRFGNQNPQFSVESLANLTGLISFNASRFLLPGPIPLWFGSKLLTLQILDLSSCSITGNLPLNLGNLTSLKVLDLSDNRITGDIPTSLTQLSNLTVLDLSKNSISGSIPVSLTGLQNLSVLDFSSNSIYGPVPASIGSLSKLQTLNLSRNDLNSDIPPSLGELKALLHLDFGFNRLSGSVPSDFKELKNLQTLVISKNQFSGTLPDAIWSLPQLNILDLSSNNFSNMLPNVSFDSSVSLLNISSNMFYGNLTLLLSRFRVLDLSRNYFEGNVPNFITPLNTSLSSNCLQGVTNQREFSDCDSFYSKKGLTFYNSGQPPGESLPSGTGGGGISINFANLGTAFTYQQLLNATNMFSDANLIKKGHSGDVFKGVLENGIQIVVKRISLELMKNEAYLPELDFFSRFAHPRIVPFVGSCLENTTQKFLVYKYMMYRDLPSSLFYKSNSLVDDDWKSLDWITRLKIALGAAEGLSYLHHDCSPSIVHRYFKISPFFALHFISRKGASNKHLRSISSSR